MFRSLSALSLLFLSVAPIAASEAPVRSVTLFEAGLAEIGREASDPSSIVLDLPLHMVNDILKSLVVRGEGITSARISLDGESPVEDVFSTLPVSPEEMETLEDLLAALKGVPVSLVMGVGATPVEGRVMGVARPSVCGDEPCPAFVMLQDEAGAVRRLPLQDDASLRILDPSVDAGVKRGLEALRAAASGELRAVKVETEGKGPAALSYVIEAPVWKTAYKVMTGKDGSARLQAWAVIENATGEDWDDIRLTLSAGSPKTLQSNLHGRTWRVRETMEPVVAPMMEMAKAAGMEMRLNDASDAFAPSLAAAPAPAPLEASAQGTEGGVDSRFTFPKTVDLPAGRVLSLPFVAEDLPVEHRSLWQGGLYDRKGNPDLVLEIRNDLPVRLPAGIMTVEDETGGYQGDAAFPLLVPGSEETVTFGQDRKVTVEEHVEGGRRNRHVSAARGVLHVTEDELRTTTYRITSSSGERRTVEVRHPVQGDWTLLKATGAETPEPEMDWIGSRTLPFQVTLDGSDHTLVVEESHLIVENWQIGDVGPDQLETWATEEMPEADRAYILKAAELQRALQDLEGERDRLAAQMAAAADDQDRARRMLETVPDTSEARKRFLDKIMTSEDRIESFQAQVVAANERIHVARDALADHLGGEG
ncbi:DUF4139 domain-containing protein [Cereibacter sphaeroides]|uniref:DUF4139 domain-containing protein n=1 Tax=Cereibacter sphaeroides TaxID=1063 RepID=UPI001F37715A|nr:DUF4139 domain-containing protein [Cereibacter sphaeroides]MCE6959318.1 DUF4139 domain-containing protein [Cereibacter sphaeroides]MCE6972910.1 DUF4139 domain-containing protein [Cereibacter sphaeroides]